MRTIEVKDVEEIITWSFPFGDELGAATISSVLLTVLVVQGVDAAAAAMLSGAAQIAGSDVRQLLKDGVPGVRYKVRCKATLNDGRKLVRFLLLDVKTL